MVINGLSYFIPFSSAKPTDFIINPDGSRIIRKSTPTIIRMTAENDATGELELKGTLKINNMIPVPSQELVFYDISAENDAAYKDLMQKEYTYIKAHKNDIIKSAGIVYSQQCVREQLLDRDPHTLSDNERRILNKSPNYLNFTVPFSYAENQCLLYIQSLSIGV